MKKIIILSALILSSPLVSQAKEDQQSYQLKEEVSVKNHSEAEAANSFDGDGRNDSDRREKNCSPYDRSPCP